MSDMTAENYVSVDRALRELRSDGRQDVTSLNEIFGAWEQLIEQIEDGYDGSIYEYTNDLHCRAQLAAVMPLLTDRVQRLRRPELQRLDARFIAATEAGELGITRSPDGAWWRDRRPVDPGPELARDLP